MGVYHPLQSFYRRCIRKVLTRRYRKEYAAYSGTGFECNICGARYSKFVPDHPLPEDRPVLEKCRVVAGYGENILCPSCLSTARERLVMACLQKYFSIQNKRILHFSPERHLFAYLHSVANVKTADIEPGFYRDIDPGIERQDATSLTYPDHSFDLLIANHVLEHISEDVKAMREFFRVLKPGGSAILQVPYTTNVDRSIEMPTATDDASRSAYFGQRDHVRIYALEDYIARLQSAGFDVQILPADELKHFERYATQPGEQFLLIRKPSAT